MPQKYQQFLDSYGTGAIAGFLWIYNPASQRSHVNLIEAGRAVLESMQLARTGGRLRLNPLVGDDLIPFPLSPEPGGLLPFAVTDNGDQLYWVVKAGAVLPTVVISDAGMCSWATYDLPFLPFLVALVAGAVRPESFPQEFPGPPPVESVPG